MESRGGLHALDDRDAEELARQFPDIPVTYVPGNCDGRRPDLPDERCFTLEGCKS